ncbi:hypothetical protein TCAL_02652 [Tigriopus californicus]|uniref:Peptidase S1 domain-containing protein n=1 Tax=Tigriopus californicus TaxID=6832 RepID=A0A553NAW6_TIGCA|nr:elastase-1-like [Tigriopus californicus]TRY62583.1 hypothetical protein TCAL_02652 [Tigriopus californicus]|eukprot:TCALIF_02652-PA protein Name:"Similar to Mast cell protease 1A (Ovis aries)" AED:0.25 eAED:0.25 QI:15/1/1/1/0/0/4/183/277
MKLTLLLLIFTACAKQILGQDDESQTVRSNLTKVASSLPSRCGIAFPGRVIGGNVAVPHKYPWTSYLLIRKVVNGQQQNSYCGSTIISNWWLVTAAHCLDNAVQVEVRAGCLLNYQCEAIEAARGWIVHPSYDRRTLNNDIALIQVQRPLRFSRKIQPSCLPGSYLGDNRGVIVVGWGATSNNGPGSAALKEGVMVSRNSGVCSRFFGSFSPLTMICVTRYNANVCSGDSGTSAGRFIGGRFQLDGVNSYVYYKGCDQGPNVLVRVSHYVSWIRAIV